MNPENKHRGELEQDFGDPNVTRGCIGKERYPSKRHAEAAVRNMMADGRGRRTLGAYRCRNHRCRGWHTGNSTRRPDAAAVPVSDAGCCAYCSRPILEPQSPTQRVCNACLEG